MFGMFPHKNPMELRKHNFVYRERGSNESLKEEQTGTQEKIQEADMIIILCHQIIIALAWTLSRLKLR